MALITVNPDDLKRTSPPTGNYPVRIDKCELRDSKRGQPDASGQMPKEVYWEFSITDKCADAALVGQKLFGDTSIENGRGDRYLKYVAGLGLNPAAFDTDVVLGLECVAEVKQRTYKDKNTGESKFASDVISLLVGV